MPGAVPGGDRGRVAAMLRMREGALPEWAETPSAPGVSPYPRLDPGDGGRLAPGPAPSRGQRLAPGPAPSRGHAIHSATNWCTENR